METQYIPAFQSTDREGETYARIAPTCFPRGADGDSRLVHRITSYTKGALWDSVKAWFEGGPPASGAIDPQEAVVHRFTGRGGATWRIYPDGAPKEEQAAVAWDAFATPTVLDSDTFGYRWDDRAVAATDPGDGTLVTLPEYFRLVSDDEDQKSRWMPVPAEDVPEETGLKRLRFDEIRERGDRTRTSRPTTRPAAGRSPAPSPDRSRRNWATAAC